MRSLGFPYQRVKPLPPSVQRVAIQIAATKAGNAITAVTIVFVQGFFGLKTIFSIIQIP